MHSTLKKPHTCRLVLSLNLALVSGCLPTNDATTCDAAQPAGGSASSAGTGDSVAGSGVSDPSGAGGTATSGGGGGGGVAAAAATAGAATGGSAGTAPDSTACGQVLLEQCESTPDCAPLSGQRIAGDPLCVAPLEAIACGTALGCTVNATRATDPQGGDWIFPTACIPAGWTDSSTSGTRFDPCSE